MILYLALIVLMVISGWKVFEKAGQPGWAILVPFYNLYILTVIAKKEAWWMILFFIPIVSIVAAIIINIEIAKNFGKDAGFGVGMALLGFIFWPLLAFSDATYDGGQTETNDEVLDAA
ncbi:MAG: signal peptidase I [Crocinitomicaceae bacterium]|nr:signal peptidase I [Crocinitomicaceae bacterium]